MSSKLTLEQERKIEENRKKALEIRARKLANVNSASPQTSTGSTCSEQVSSRNPTTTSAPRLGHHQPFQKVSLTSGQSVSKCNMSDNNKLSIPPSSSSGVVGSFYKQVSRSNQTASSSACSAGPPPRPRPVLVGGRCVSHSRDRFRVEVGYHAELIAVFKTIPSKNYGKCLPFCTSMF